MKKIYKMLCLAAMMIASVTARAQYTAELTSDPVESYYCASKTFSADEIAGALGVDTVSLKEILSTTGSVYLKAGDDKTNACTGNPNENVFWMNKEGAVQTYSDAGTCWYAGLFYNAEEKNLETNEVTPSNVGVVLGQMPGIFKKIYENSVLKATLYLVKDDKTVSFDITLTINAAQKPGISDAVTTLADLTIVKEYEMELPFVYGKEYEGKTVSVDLEGFYEALGTDSTVFDANVADYTYTKTIKTTKASEDAIAVYSWNEVLEKPADASSGAWFGRYYNITDDGTDDVYVGNAPMGWGSTNNTFYTQNITLNQGKFSIVTGQYPGAMKTGDKFESNLYIINGNKAALVKLFTNVYVPEMPPFAEMTKAGADTVVISAVQDDNYTTKAIKVDMNAVVAALGCTTSDIAELYSFEEEGKLSTNHTESSGGFYFNEDGYIDTWGGNATFFVAVVDLPNGKFSIGQRAGKYTSIEEAKTVAADIIFAYGDKYYSLNVKYTITPKPVNEEPINYVLKSTEGLNKQIVPNTVAYKGTEKTTLDLDYIKSIIGTTEFKIFADTVYTNPETNEKTVAWSDKYNCTPAPGFWFGSTTFDQDGVSCVSADGWSNSSSFGFTYSEGVITWYEIPDARQVGDAYTANLYLVNEETYDYIKYVINVSYVEEIAPEAEVVLNESVAVYVDESSKDEFKGLVNTQKVCEALGITDLASVKDDVNIVIVKSPTLTTTAGLDNWNSYTAEGYMNDEESKCAFSVTINVVKGEFVVLADFIDPTNQQMDAVVNIGLEYAGKRVMFKVTFTKDDPTAIATVNASRNSGTVYTISGIKANASAKGVVIENGKKVVK